MTVLDTTTHRLDRRASRLRHYVMCAPTYFEVSYAINPWMHPEQGVDRDLALRQWESLRSTYESLGHRVDLVVPEPGLPDMVFAANGGLVVGDRAYGARFAYPQRRPEAQTYLRWYKAQGVGTITEPVQTNEGEGDFLTLGSMVLAGTGFRTSIAAHIEAAEALDRPVVSLELVDPRFYHLDTALAVLDDGNGVAPADVAYFPGAFSAHSRRTLRDLFPDALLVDEAEALTFALNSVSDGRHVVVPAASVRFAAALERRGYEPVAVELGELLKAGGSVKCCTMELHA